MVKIMIKYLYNGEYYNTIYEAEDAAYEVAERTYDDMLDDCYEDVNVCGYTYSPSVALERLDPIAYRCGLSDYHNSLLSDIEEVEIDDEDEEESDEE